MSELRSQIVEDNERLEALKAAHDEAVRKIQAEMAMFTPAHAASDHGYCRGLRFSLAALGVKEEPK